MTSQGKRSRQERAHRAPGAGDASNLVYKPLEPCRIMDTRNATAGSRVQGPIVGGSLKQIPAHHRGIELEHLRPDGDADRIAA